MHPTIIMTVARQAQTERRRRATVARQAQTERRRRAGISLRPRFS